MGRPLFLYGTLLDPAVLTRFGGRPRDARPAWVSGRRRVLFRGTRFPTLLPGAGRVEGVLLRPTPTVLARLRTYEGPCYRLYPLRVATRRGTRWARAWLVPRRLADPARAWP